MYNTQAKHSRSGFTLVEILVVLAIIAILAAILFPAFSKARESGRQANCAANLQKIYFAVRQYYDDEKRYPGSLAVLLPNTSSLVHYTGNAPASATPNTNGTGFLKVSDKAFQCLNDPNEPSFPRSSYGDLSDNWTDLSAGPPKTGATRDMGHWVYNYWGYNDSTQDGTAYPNMAVAASASAALRVDPNYPSAGSPAYDLTNNPIKYSLSNRFAPESTIITHCVYHRPQTAANLLDESLLYTTPANDKGARDIILRLDGTAKVTDVSRFPGATYVDEQWINQANIAK